MLDGNRITALLPIKAHSARLPGKNFRAFRGAPLWTWIVNSLHMVPEIDEILIDTDVEDRDLLTAFGSHGRLLRRPRRLRGDGVSMNELIANEMEVAPADIYLQTHATNPLVRPETFSAVLGSMLNQDGIDSVFTVDAIRARFWTADTTPINHDPGAAPITQNVIPLLKENSCAYAFTRRSFLSSGHSRIGQNPLPIAMDPRESIDIDTQEDWDIAEALAMHRESGIC